MSGDVQPRKRKDKKRKKDDLGVDEPRGTSASLGEGDSFMHSHHEHGTGGHWCAKVIFFSLLAILVGLIGLIILENRGLSELEANSVQSQYSGVLEGWLEDAPDDDHHDTHTLELNHHDDENDAEEHGDEVEHSDEIEGDDHDDDEDDESHDDDDDEAHDGEADDDDESPENDEDEAEDGDDDEEAQDDEEGSQEQDLEANDEDEELPYRKYYQENAAEPDDDDDDDEDDDDDDDEANDNAKDADDDDEEENDKLSNEADQDDDDDDNDDDEANNQSLENDDQENEDDNSGENDVNDNARENEADSEENNNEDEEEHDEEDEEDASLEVEKIEQEASEEEEPISTELPALPEPDDDDDDDKAQESVEYEAPEADDDDDDVTDDDFLEADDDEPPVERITAPAGKPFAEEEEETSSEKPADTLAEEEEYEKRQEELRKEEASASHKDGGNSLEDQWPGEPSDAYWRRQLDQAEQEFNQGAWLAAAERAGAKPLQASARARLTVAKALDAAAEHQRDNAMLGRAITAYLELLKMNERLSDKKLLEVAERTINRIQFRGNYLNAEPVYRLLIRRFPDDASHRTNMTVMFLMANRADLAEDLLKETIKRWPDDRLALAQYGFVIKTQHNRLKEAADLLQRALEGDTGPATEPRFYYHLGDTLLLLGRFKEAHEVHKRAASHGHFLSAAQRSLYNVPRLKGRPWWNIEETPYVKLARALEKSWRTILREGEAAKAIYEQEKEGLKERGEWSQLDLFARGREIPGRCDRAPVTCSVVRGEVAAAGCRRGQVKFSSMQAGTHVRPHVGPTNCRLRMHLGLSNTKDTFIRVDQETRQWKEGKVFVFDDSFEHEVWHNGTGSRLVLIVDVWHPELTAAERRQLPAI